MDTNSDLKTAQEHPNVLVGILKRTAQILFVFVLLGALLFVAAGRLDWGWAWAYLGVMLANTLGTAAILLRLDPGMVAERGEAKMSQGWDKLISLLYSFAAYLIFPVVAGLDDRFAWSWTFGLAGHIAGGIVLLAGLLLGSWAMIANTFFSTAVRIQGERGHAVCTSGPYRFVRHPGYVGFSLNALGGALLLGSWWALLPAAAAAVLLALRTHFEDRLLQAELPGYKEYTQAVRWRWLPGVW